MYRLPDFFCLLLFFSPGSIIQWYYLYESVDSDLEKNTDHQIGLINGKGNINNNQGTPFDTTWFFHRYIYKYVPINLSHIRKIQNQFSQLFNPLARIGPYF